MVVASLTVAACGTKPSVTAPVDRCPALTADRWNPALQQALEETFGETLRRRFGSRAVHVLMDLATVTPPGVVADGGRLFIARRIGPEKFEMPEPGKGGELMFVLEPCTAKVLKIGKLADLEIEPKPRTPRDDPEEPEASPR